MGPGEKSERHRGKRGRPRRARAPDTSKARRKPSKAGSSLEAAMFVLPTLGLAVQQGVRLSTNAVTRAAVVRAHTVDRDICPWEKLSPLFACVIRIWTNLGGSVQLQWLLRRLRQRRTGVQLVSELKMKTLGLRLRRRPESQKAADHGGRMPNRQLQRPFKPTGHGLQRASLRSTMRPQTIIWSTPCQVRLSKWQAPSKMRQRRHGLQGWTRLRGARNRLLH